MQRRTTDESDDFGAHTAEEYLFTFLRERGRRQDLPESFTSRLLRALRHYGVDSLESSDELDRALFRLFKSRQRMRRQAGPILHLLKCRLASVERSPEPPPSELRGLLDRLAVETEGRFPAVSDQARELRYRWFDQPLADRLRSDALARAEVALARLAEAPRSAELIHELIESPYPLQAFLSERFAGADPAIREVILEVLLRRYYLLRDLDLEYSQLDGLTICRLDYAFRGDEIRVCATHAELDDAESAIATLARAAGECADERQPALELYLWSDGALPDADTNSKRLLAALAQTDLDDRLRRAVVVISGGERGGIRDKQVFTFRPGPDGLAEQVIYRGIHPLLSSRLSLWRLRNFEIQRLPSPEDLYLYHCVGRENPRDERLIALGEIRDLTPVVDDDGTLIAVPEVERMMSMAVAGLRRFQSARTERSRLHWNRIHLFVRSTLDLDRADLEALIYKIAPQTQGLGVERVVVQARMPDRETGDVVERLLDVSNPAGSHGLAIQLREIPDNPMLPLGAYEQKVVRSRQRGLTYPYEIVKLLASEGGDSTFPPGKFVEHELEDGALVPIEREPGQNQANVVVGVLTSYTDKVPEGVTRVALFGDPTRGMGSLAEPECARIIAAIDLAERMKVPVEFYAVSAGAKISMESGVENLDWTALVLRRIVEFTQVGGEINVLVCGVNVGAQPYWNAEATMLMHTRGILVMVPGSAMVLTGKRALDYSGGVSAEDNEGIGGYERVMGPNGQAQYAARDIADACRILLEHYDTTYVVPGETFPRRAKTTDPSGRDVGTAPHGTDGIYSFATIGEIFDEEHNPGRKKPFDIRRVMGAVIDQD
ncbi:MAG: hypothetical protein KJO07_06210, partial [Deltaproteobacteria bacterium]|nr:hypothetical protein [Deltaproteobacteria bacterium]